MAARATRILRRLCRDDADARGNACSPGGRGHHVRFTVRERLILLDTWMRSGLPAKDFSGLVGVSQHTLYKWKERLRCNCVRSAVALG